MATEDLNSRINGPRPDGEHGIDLHLGNYENPSLHLLEDSRDLSFSSTS